MRALVAQHGPRKWTLIASRLKNKTQKQVYARWRDYLQPGLTTKPWTKEEQERLVELQAHVESVGGAGAADARAIAQRHQKSLPRHEAQDRTAQQARRVEPEPDVDGQLEGTSKNTAGKSKKSGNQSLALGVMSEGGTARRNRWRSRGFCWRTRRRA